MIHKIKALYDNGQRLSVRTISKQLSISRSNVRIKLEQQIERWRAKSSWLTP